MLEHRVSHKPRPVNLEKFEVGVTKMIYVFRNFACLSSDENDDRFYRSTYEVNTGLKVVRNSRLRRVIDSSYAESQLEEIR